MAKNFKRMSQIKNLPNVPTKVDALGFPLGSDKLTSVLGAKGVKKGSRIVEPVNEELRPILRKLEVGNGASTMNLTKARRVLGIMRESINVSSGKPTLSDLEALAEEYLRRKEVPYVIQASFLGGRNSVAGSGVIVDILIRGTVGWIAVAMQGSRWHSKAFSGGANFVARVKVVGLKHLGVAVVEYVEVWDTHAWMHQDRVFDKMVLGLEWMPGYQAGN